MPPDPPRSLRPLGTRYRGPIAPNRLHFPYELLPKNILRRLPFTYIVSRLWNKLPAHIKTSSKLSDFTRNLKAFDFSKLGPSCHCNSCI